MSKPVTFTARRWIPDFPGCDGKPRLDYWCDRCGYCADPKVDQTSLDEAVHLAATREHRCPLPAYAWDEWRIEAFERGMLPDTAGMGRALLREHHQHGWGGALDGQAMLEWGLADPQAAAEAWERALDGGAELEAKGRQPRTTAKGKLR